MAARRGKNQARRNGGKGGRPAWVWLVAGLAIGAVVFLAVPGLLKKDGDGFVRFGPRADPDAQPAPIADTEAIADTPAGEAPAETAPQYDFYTVLPGNEVRMSDAELAASAREEEARRAQAEARRARDALEGRTPEPPSVAAAPAASTATTAAASTATASGTNAPAPVQAAAAPGDGARYILQAGAFGAPGDAEEVKAKLAMLGLGARVETGQANGKTVYRVRMGPYSTASELAEAKQKLAGSGLPAMAIKAQ
ncbi:SPOR domain-containing protein [Pseudoxanthomonas koreensis]|uniref:SPOR domain-containing protein n=1 Tax=Pseudoxanthomonas koreensis TaxID=266061 RepID=UPI0013915F8E|nr:SPOR domain-containing protein [Pseudoxanthomonas koreensis]KAF1697100.1 sporulation protein [Pseudoxanthomonas koreensis]